MMLARVNTKALAAALKRTMPATMAGRLPILNGVRLEVSRKTLTITTTNIDLTIEASLPCEPGAVKGVVIPPAGLLSKLVANIGAETTEISGEDLDVTVTGGDMVASLRGHKITEWPAVTHCEAETHAQLDRATLDRIGRIAPFVRTEGDISPMHGVYFGEGEVRATDGYRAGVVDIDPPLPFPPITVPAETLRAVLGTVDDVVMISDGELVTFTDDETRWTTRGMSGDYPNLGHFFEVAKPFAATFPTGQLIETLKRVAALESGTATVKFAIEGDKVQLSTVTADVGSVVDFVPVSSPEGDDWAVQYVVKYLGPVLAAFDDRDEIEIRMDDKKPSILRTDHIRALIMPKWDPKAAA